MLSPLLQVYSRTDLEFVSGKGCYLKTRGGKKYLDLGSGIAVNSLGYGNKKLAKALSKMALKPWHVSNLYQISGQEELAEKLVKNSSCDQVFFCNSGTEAVEAAIKIVKKNFAKSKIKKEILSFSGGFHGRSLGAISAAGTSKYQEGYKPLLPGFKTIPYKDFNSVGLRKHISNKTAAIIIEPIQGEGGIYQFDKKFLEEIYQICQKKKIILIADEVQSGMGRSGKFFSYQHTKIKPDIITSAKGIGGGFPLAACLVKKDIAKAMTAGSHGGTYGGNPLAMAVGNVVVDQILDKKFQNKIIENGKYFKQKLDILQKKYPKLISEVRGLGLILGIRLPKKYMDLVNLLRENKVLTVPASNEVIRILPPLVISKKEIDIAVKIMDKCLNKLK